MKLYRWAMAWFRLILYFSDRCSTLCTRIFPLFDGCSMKVVGRIFTCPIWLKMTQLAYSTIKPFKALQTCFEMNTRYHRRWREQYQNTVLGVADGHNKPVKYDLLSGFYSVYSLNAQRRPQSKSHAPGTMAQSELSQRSTNVNCQFIRLHWCRIQRCSSWYNGLHVGLWRIIFRNDGR